MTSQIYPITRISHSLEMEVRRILYFAARLPDHTLQNRGFLVLPTLLHKAYKNTIVFPDLAYSKIPEFWHRTQKLGLHTPITAPPDLIHATADIVRPIYREKLYENAQTQLLAGWQDIESVFWNNLFILFPYYRDRITRVNIYLTQSGTITSFSLARHTIHTINIMARLDCPLDKIVWAILACLFRPKMEDELKFTWYEIEAVVDWLIQESSLNPVKPSQATVTSLRSNQHAKLMQESRRYLAQLGLTNQLNPWGKNGKSITYSGIPLEGLTPRQQLLLEVMLTKRGLTVNYDEIAAVLWPNGEEFSLWAIVKEIARIRHCLRRAGITHPVIQSHRKQGYSLT